MIDQENNPLPQNNLPNQQADNNPQMSSMPSFQSVNSLNLEQKNDDDGAQFEVVQSKSDKRINHEEIKKLFNEQLAKEEQERLEIEMRRKQSMKNPKIQSKQQIKRVSNDERANKENNNEKLKALTEQSNRIKKGIEQYCKKYKSMYRPSMYDTKMNRFRFDNKQKLFFHLCYGLFQLRDLDPIELSEYEREIVQLDPYDVCRKLSFAVDLQMVKILNKNDKYEIGRQYKSQFQTLLNNIKDQNNLELKRKILAKTLTPQKIAIANEIEFYTTAKREEILEKQKRYIAEFTVENVVNPFAENENDEIMDRPNIEYQAPKEEQFPVLKPIKSGIINRYLEQSSLLQIQEMLSTNQLNKMLKRLEEDLQGRSRTLLINNFKEVFDL